MDADPQRPCEHLLRQAGEASQGSTVAAALPTCVADGRRVAWSPERFVFKEAPSALFHGTGARRRRVTAW